MKKNFKRRISLSIIAGLLILSLSACGGKKDISSAKNKDPISAKEAFEQEGIWFHYDSMIAKDVKIDFIFIFDGDGNVTCYRTNITYADLLGLSKKDIIELAKEQDKTLFDETIQRNLYTAENTDLSQYIYSSYNNEEEFRVFLDAMASKFSALEYQEPKAYPFTLKIETDGSGNLTAKEDLVYSYTTWSTAIFEGEDFYEWPTMEQLMEWDGYHEYNKNLHLYPAPGNMAVYDMQFNGFSQLSLLVEEGHPGFTLDTPDTKGIEVD